jgi:hypothetical protein
MKVSLRCKIQKNCDVTQQTLIIIKSIVKSKKRLLPVKIISFFLIRLIVAKNFLPRPRTALITITTAITTSTAILATTATSATSASLTTTVN